MFKWTAMRRLTRQFLASSLMNSAVLWITIWWAFWHAKPFFFLQKQILWTVLKMKFFRNSQQQMGNQQPPQQQLNDPMSNMGPQGMTMNNQVSNGNLLLHQNFLSFPLLFFRIWIAFSRQPWWETGCHCYCSCRISFYFLLLQQLRFSYISIHSYLLPALFISWNIWQYIWSSFLLLL